jgi:Rrf2 family protein
MKFSMKSDYALRSMMTLVKYYGKAPVSIRELAKINDVPKRFLEQIMLELKEKGYVDSTLGRDGGYFLSAAPENITMGEVVRHFDGILAPIGCVSASHYQQCSQEDTCKFRKIPLDIRNYIASLLDNTTLADLSKNKPVKTEDILYSHNGTKTDTDSYSLKEKQ